MVAKRILYWLRRLFQLWGVYARMDFLLMTRDFRTFATWALSDTVLNFASITGMLLLAQRFGGIGGWTVAQVFFLLGYSALVDGVIAIFFSYNVAFLSRRLGRGQFDHTLIQPVPIPLALLTEGFSPMFGIPTTIPGICLLYYSLSALHLVTSVGWWLWFGINLLASVAVVMAFQVGWGSLAFRAPRAAEELSSSTMQLINQLKSYPLDGIGGWLMGGLLSALPLGFVTWLPSLALLGMQHSPFALLQTPLAGLLFMAIAIRVFQKGLRYYERIGSQRYSQFGHRC